MDTFTILFWIFTRRGIPEVYDLVDVVDVI